MDNFTAVNVAWHWTLSSYSILFLFSNFSGLVWFIVKVWLYLDKFNAYFLCPVNNFTEYALDICCPKTSCLPLLQAVFLCSLLSPGLDLRNVSLSTRIITVPFFVPVTMQSQSLFANWWQSGWIIYPQTPLFLGVDPFFLWWIRTTHPAPHCSILINLM